MALVKCPECGKENVSDSAEACPECGFGIKAYYEKIRDFKYGAFKMAVNANKPIQPIKFVFKNPKGIYKLYKKNKCIESIILDPIYPNNELDYYERIEDLRNKTYESIIGG